MWSALKRQHQLWAIVTLSLISFTGLQGFSELWDGEKLSLLKVASSIVFVLGTCLSFVANRYWREIWKKFPLLNKAIFPDLNGHWRGQLHTTWVDPVTGTGPGPINADLYIEMGLLNISIRQTTNESPSFSTRVILEPDPDADIYRLWYTYTNKPNARVSYRSAQHDGAAWLEVSLKINPSQLSGQYFTSRRTSGDIIYNRVADTVVAAI